MVEIAGANAETLMTDVNGTVTFHTVDFERGEVRPIQGSPVYENAIVCRFSPRTGDIAIIATELALHIVDTTTMKEKLQLPLPNIASIQFSPLEKTFVTASKY